MNIVIDVGPNLAALIQLGGALATIGVFAWIFFKD